MSLNSLTSFWVKCQNLFSNLLLKMFLVISANTSVRSSFNSHENEELKARPRGAARRRPGSLDEAARAQGPVKTKGGVGQEAERRGPPGTTSLDFPRPPGAPHLDHEVGGIRQPRVRTTLGSASRSVTQAHARGQARARGGGW